MRAKAKHYGMSSADAAAFKNDTKTDLVKEIVRLIKTEKKKP